ncbi:hypothetical protein [Ruficoccus sp. ZRK36]|uniref:hypothetical protein n=1 Tax=Ruficoccus sp. ZRK36 TaxID=2866311 RepID=UPI001C72A0AE|nr:hypothetical protein [Ruficoccus sp. ZRK36]QYY36174.1 hypothetical protein K0V07_01615 [Ruficoccus sp. ZRK36]
MGKSAIKKILISSVNYFFELFFKPKFKKSASRKALFGLSKERPAGVLPFGKDAQKEDFLLVRQQPF